jgi:sulfofructose kinase
MARPSRLVHPQWCPQAASDSAGSAMTDAPPQPLVVCAGHATLDAVLAVPRLPHPDERVPATTGVLAGGGPAATAAVTLARLGVQVAFAGRVGDDAAGAWIRDGLGAAGVDTSLLESVPGASPFTAVLLDTDGGRALVPAPGRLPELAMSAALAERITDAAWLHVDHVGARLLPAVRAAGLGARISIDGGNPIQGLSLDGVDLYAPTAAAALARTGARTLQDALAACLDEGARIVVATDGARGAVAAWHEPGGTLRLAHAPGIPVDDLVSTLGAGDVFHGALLAAIVEGRAIEEALHVANTVAAASTRALDGRSGIPDRDQLEALLAGRAARPATRRATVVTA